MAARSYGQYCGVTTAVELIGERWALLIVRDLFVGPRRYTDLKQGLPRIPTNILSTRLKELQEGGVVRRVPLRRCGLVYELTEYGRALEPIVLAIGRWGVQGMGEPTPDDVVTPDSLTMALRTSFQPGGDDLDIELHVGDIALRIVTETGKLRVAQVSPPPTITVAPPPDGDPEAVIAAGPGIRLLIGGQVSAAEAVERGIATVVRGDLRVLDAFASTFHIAPVPSEGT